MPPKTLWGAAARTLWLWNEPSLHQKEAITLGIRDGVKGDVAVRGFHMIAQLIGGLYDVGRLRR